MMCDMAVLLVHVHYDGSHLACVETREGHTFSLVKVLTATGYKQHAMNSQVASLYCGLIAGKAKQGVKSLIMFDHYLGFILCCQGTWALKHPAQTTWDLGLHCIILTFQKLKS